LVGIPRLAVYIGDHLMIFMTWAGHARRWSFVFFEIRIKVSGIRNRFAFQIWIRGAPAFRSRL